MQVDLGCGPHKKEGFIGIDLLAYPNVDIVADLNKGIPIDNDSVDYLYTSHFLEHTNDLYMIMDEIYRVCKHGAFVEIIVPHFSINTYEFHHRVFRYSSLYDYDIDKVASHPSLAYFRVLSRKLEFTNEFLSKFFTKHHYFYEKHLWWLIPCKQIHIMLQVDKNNLKHRKVNENASSFEL